MKGMRFKVEKYRMVRTDFWKNPIVSEEMTPVDKYFYLYLLTNPDTTQIESIKLRTSKWLLIWATPSNVCIH